MLFSYVTLLKTVDASALKNPDLGKRLEDIMLALLILLFIWPLLIIISVAVRCSSPGPLLFTQKRVGFKGKLITVYKFRTMYHEFRDPDAEMLVSRNDSRVTQAGRFLRRTSLDELPQLLNVLQGTMSIVGPRPHARGAKANGRLYQEIDERYEYRHTVKPGITGWAQVNGWRGETDSEDKLIKRLEHDIYYIENRSILLEARILARTPLAALDINAY